MSHHSYSPAASPSSAHSWESGSDDPLDQNNNAEVEIPRRPFKSTVVLPARNQYERVPVLDDMKNHLLVTLVGGSWGDLAPFMQTLLPLWGEEEGTDVEPEMRLLPVASPRVREQLTSTSVIRYDFSKFQFAPWSEDIGCSYCEDGGRCRIRLSNVPLDFRHRGAIMRIVSCFGELVSCQHLSFRQSDITTVKCTVDVDKKSLTQVC